MQNLAKSNQKALLRKLMRTVLRSEMSEAEKLRQSACVTGYLAAGSHKRFADAKHIALYLAMRQEEVDTTPLIEQLLALRESGHKERHVYVPHVEMGAGSSSSSSSSSGMVFYELKSLEQYRTEMNTDNKYGLRQFNQVENMRQADPRLFDLVVVPGLCFDRIDQQQQQTKTDGKVISRLGRGKGYYDRFLAAIPDCYTLAIGFNQQFVPLSETLRGKEMRVPVDEERDELLNEFLCEQLVLARLNNNSSSSAPQHE